MDLYIDVSELFGFADAMDTAADEFDGEMTWASYAILHEGIGYAKEEVPVEQGNLKGDIRILDGPDSSGGSYGTDLVYAWQREEGGWIYPRNGEYLWFEIDGQLIRVKKVYQEGSHYMEKSLERLESRVKPIYQLAIDRVLGRI